MSANPSLPPVALPELTERPWLRASDGAKWQLSIQRPVTHSPRAALLCVPAMGTPARFYAPLQTEMARRGFVCAVTELRGNGTSSVRASRNVSFGYHELLTLDLPVAVRAVRQRTRGEPLFLVGHSLGGQLALLSSALDSSGIAGVVTIAACSVHFRGWRFPENALIAVGMHTAALLATVVGHFPGRRLRFAGNEARGVIHDWARNGRTGRYDLSNGPYDLEAAMRSLSLPILGISLAGDHLAPPRAVDNLMAKMPNATVTRRHLGLADLPGAGSTHFRWVRHPQSIGAEVADWIESRGSGSCNLIQTGQTASAQANAAGSSPAPGP